MFQRSAAVRQAWIVVEWLGINVQDKMMIFMNRWK